MKKVRGLFTKRRVLIAVAIYGLVYFGGARSYWLTHECVRSHTVEGYNSVYEQETSYEVCDYTVDNGKRWTVIGPIEGVIDIFA